MNLDKIQAYRDLPRNDMGQIGLTPFQPKAKRITLDKVLDDPKPKPLSYFDRRKPENKQKHRNHFKFVGILPDFHGFERVRCIAAMRIKHFKEKRTFINVFEFLRLDEMVLKMKLVCKKFYMLSWSGELLNKLCFHAFGADLYEEIKYRVAKRLHKLKNNIEDKPRYFVETTTEEERSDSFSSAGEEGRAHIRQDQCSSADEENALKDMFRRNAREEHYFDKEQKKDRKQREIDMKIIEKCRFNREPIPEELKTKYADELFEYKQNAEKKDEEFKNIQLMKRKERLAYQMKKAKTKEMSKKREFYEKYLPRESDEKEAPGFKRKLLLFYSLKRRCSNCGYIDITLDLESQVIICPVLKRSICYTCKNSDAFALISATSAARRYKIDKKDIDMLGLPYLDVPNPYYTALKMKLYYEYMIVENLHKVQQWRDFKKKKNQANLKEHMDWKRRNKLDKKVHQTILALEIEFRRDPNSKKMTVTRDEIESIYIADPLMQRYLMDKTKFQLAQIIDLIDDGRSKEVVRKMIEKEERAKLLKSGVPVEKLPKKLKPEGLKKDKKKDKKKKKDTKKEKERKILAARRAEQMRSTISGGVKKGDPKLNELEDEKRRKQKQLDKIKEKMKKAKKKNLSDSSDE